MITEGNNRRIVELTPGQILEAIKGMIEGWEKMEENVSSLRTANEQYKVRLDFLEKQHLDDMAKNDRLLALQTTPWRIRIDGEQSQQSKE